MSVQPLDGTPGGPVCPRCGDALAAGAALPVAGSAGSGSRSPRGTHRRPPAAVPREGDPFAGFGAGCDHLDRRDRARRLGVIARRAGIAAAVLGVVALVRPPAR